MHDEVGVGAEVGVVVITHPQLHQGHVTCAATKSLFVASSA